MSAGFYVEDGVLKEAGVVIKEFGLNVPDLFIEWLGNSDPTKAPSGATPLIYQTNYAANFAYLAGLGFRTIKFTLTGYHPATFTASWIDANATYLANLDALIASAEAHGIRLIPYMFSNLAQIPPCYSEPLRAISDPSSTTYATMGTFMTTIINRYKGSPAIAMWAFAGEGDLHIQNNGQFANTSTTSPSSGYSVNTDLGTPAAWVDPVDFYTFECVMAAMGRFQTMCKTLDNAAAHPGKASRATSSGNGGGYAVKRLITLSRFLQTRLNADVTDTVEIHAYADTNAYWSVDLGSTYEVYLKNLKTWAARVGKPVIVGEFSIPQNFSAIDGDPRNFIQQQKRMVASLASTEVQLACLWNWPAIIGTDINWSFRADEVSANRGAELTWLSQFNTAYKGGF